MQIVLTERIDPEMKKLLSYATSEQKIEREYHKYIQDPDRCLYVMDEYVGCIGVHFFSRTSCKITHLAVSPSHRQKHIATKMIHFICFQHPHIQSITAETDRDGVGFYRRYGFSIKTLGETYPGVERFSCVYRINK